MLVWNQWMLEHVCRALCELWWKVQVYKMCSQTQTSIMIGRGTLQASSRPKKAIFRKTAEKPAVFSPSLKGAGILPTWRRPEGFVSCLWGVLQSSFVFQRFGFRRQRAGLFSRGEALRFNQEKLVGALLGAGRNPLDRSWLWDMKKFGVGPGEEERGSPWLCGGHWK